MADANIFEEAACGADDCAVAAGVVLAVLGKEKGFGASALAAESVGLSSFLGWFHVKLPVVDGDCVLVGALKRPEEAVGAAPCLVAAKRFGVPVDWVVPGLAPKRPPPVAEDWSAGFCPNKGAAGWALSVF